MRDQCTYRISGIGRLQIKLENFCKLSMDELLLSMYSSKITKQHKNKTFNDYTKTTRKNLIRTARNNEIFSNNITLVKKEDIYGFYNLRQHGY